MHDLRVFRDTGVSFAAATAVSGVRKLAQLFAMELLNEADSAYYLKESGCNFIERLHKGTSEFDVVTAFGASKSRVRKMLRARARPDTPRDEQLADAKIVSMLLDDDTLTLTILVSSRGGTSARVQLPPIRLG